MPVEITMPALSPTMEEGTLAKWMVKVGDRVQSGDLLAEIETDKATMEFEAIDEGVVTALSVAEGTEGVKVGTVIAVIAGEGEDASAASAAVATPPSKTVRAEPVEAVPAAARLEKDSPSTGSGRTDVSGSSSGARIIASPLAKRIAADRGIDLGGITGTGPNGRIIKADLDGKEAGPAGVGVPPPSARQAQPERTVLETATSAPSVRPEPVEGLSLTASAIPHEVVKLSGMRKIIARRLTESKQQVPHIYLTLDVRLDALLKLRGDLNASLESRGIKLSVNDLIIKALGVALMQVPKCNVSFAGDSMLMYSRADISVAVSVPNGLITPIITDASNKSVSVISVEMAALAAKAKDGKLQPHEYQGGTASLSNMGMMGIKQFDAVINPPQAMILAVGAGEKRPYVVDDALAIATVMSLTGSFDHRAIDGADGAQLMQTIKGLIEKPLGLVA